MVKKRSNSEKAHPWRICPQGQHWVTEHTRSTQRGLAPVKGHCRANRSGKDQIYPDELIKISQAYFADLEIKPAKNNLGFRYKGNKYDDLIAGWTQFWNEVLKPDENLDPNLVKALIATESGFERDAKTRAGKRAGWARGLMQLTDWALEILKDEKGEIRDQYVNLDQGDLTDPSLNIAAGVRWLHRKRETARAKLKRKATWLEAAADYKSYLEDWQENPNHKQMKKLEQFYDTLSKK